MLQEFLTAEDFLDDNGNPAGGQILGTGLAITWQNGPLGRGVDRLVPNGAFVETVIEAARHRLTFYQEASNGRFACTENQSALFHLGEALKILNVRTQRREAQNTEGTHEGN